ncbi:MAG: DNA helicase RecQ [Fibrobacterota bacterium]|nr:DNA helicase RecQ [Fibrobacterota bacterium]
MPDPTTARAETGAYDEEPLRSPAVSELLLLTALSRTFGYSSFRPHQKEIVEQILAGRDVLAIMPTGGGKSLCYQLPARMAAGTAIVISPLISLMKDQVDSARENNMAAAYLNSSLTGAQASQVYRRLEDGSLDLLYISPERFAMESFIASLKAARVSFFAIDEAHCLSEWGHDFRPDYNSLSAIRRHFPRAPIAAFTATATNAVQQDILQKLTLKNPYQVRASFDRPNLHYEVRPKRDIDAQLLAFLKEHPDEPGIIYRTTRTGVEKTAAYLNAKGIKAMAYHAGLPQKDRESNQDAFSLDEVQVIVATIAFGMGIDKSNVRFVLHADLPKNLEGYYQETGRAGRDGDPSLCVLFYGGGDIPKLRHFLDQIVDEEERALAVRRLNQMADFAGRNLCRRRQILAYFEEEYPESNCASCDICTGKASTIDATREAQMVLSALVRTGERFGAAHVVDVLTGADTKKVRELGHDQIKTYGVGKFRDKSFWRSLMGEMLGRGLIGLDPGPYPVLKLTPVCLPVLQGKETFQILEMAGSKAGPEGKSRHTRAAEGAEDIDQVFFDKLRALRKTLAQRQGIPPYMVFSDKTLHEMCRHKPTTLSAFREISGVGDAKRDRYGMEFVQEIRAHS